MPVYNCNSIFILPYMVTVATIYFVNNDLQLELPNQREAKRILLYL